MLPVRQNAIWLPRLPLPLYQRTVRSLLTRALGSLHVILVSAHQLPFAFPARGFTNLHRFSPRLLLRHWFHLVLSAPSPPHSPPHSVCANAMLRVYVQDAASSSDSDRLAGACVAARLLLFVRFFASFFLSLTTAPFRSGSPGWVLHGFWFHRIVPAPQFCTVFSASAMPGFAHLILPPGFFLCS